MEDEAAATRLTSQARALGSIFSRPPPVVPLRPPVSLTLAETTDFPPIAVTHVVPPDAAPGEAADEDDGRATDDGSPGPALGLQDRDPAPVPDARPAPGPASPAAIPPDADIVADAADDHWEPLPWASPLPAFNISTPRQIEG